MTRPRRQRVTSVEHASIMRDNSNMSSRPCSPSPIRVGGQL
ncbi:hypothetical protein C791_0197 [Amycolatopsis azurea DSM 43854]|uniref:Uncharacterized protein n=1 Tax=Amycolatopsis azurea DSM 43854 TaxID=1238180 RepID=M2QUM3_9PSEU|nr:hypothetical protein C791_0197 [Amycolatopsis azurea DSM 43854]